MPTLLVITELRDLTDRQLLELMFNQQTQILERLTTMSQIATDTNASVNTLDGKVDTLIGLVQPSIQTLRDQLAAALQQATALQAALTAAQSDAAADATTLTGTLQAANAEAVKVDAAIATLTPPTTPTPPPAG